MTTEEFSLQFDLLYNNIASNTGPGIDEYEKSVYLTKAQLEIVKQYNNIANKYNKGFDQSEKRRVDLKELIVDHKTSNKIQNSNNIDSEFNSFFFEIPDDVFLIKFERGFFVRECDNSESLVRLDIVPIPLDEYNEKIDNPFRQPYNKEAWRVDYPRSEFQTGLLPSEIKNVVEIISSEELASYHMRYVKYPKPIILTSLVDFYGDGETLTIEGLSNKTSCELNQEIHQEILDRAVELATRDYRENSLQSKVELNNRNN